MNTKLTLRLDDSLINQAKKYAKKEGKSVSQIVADYFHAIKNSSNDSSNEKKIKIGPLTTKLQGCLKGTSIKLKNYKQHLERKYL